VSPKARKRKRRRDFQAPGRRRNPAAGEVPSEVAPDARRRGPRAARERPPAPWGRFPLVELVVLLGLVLLIAGFFVQGTKGVTMIAAGVTLAALAGLELSIREHFSGYKSHSTVLAGTVTVLVAGAAFFLLPAGWSQAAALIVATAVFATAFYFFRELFKRRSGGAGFR
jgi:hypothetical protein